MRYFKILSLISIVCLVTFNAISVSIAEENETKTETKEYQAEAYRTSMKINIDGDLDEPDWQKAKPITKFVQVQPN